MDTVKIDRKESGEAMRHRAMGWTRTQAESIPQAVCVSVYLLLCCDGYVYAASFPKSDIGYTSCNTSLDKQLKKMDVL